jgi:DNA-binding transcriptional MerR regulator/methylmalonyl-CoA mutase cobalamin-binding subunit
MPRSLHPAEAEATYALGAVVRLTGLSAHVIRAWERRYGAVRPRRTAGGTRRYGEHEVARLRLLAAAVAAGHRIGELARLDDDAIERLLSARVDRLPGPPPLDALITAAERLDLAELERGLGLQLGALGPAVFARDVVAPLLREIGDRWEHGRASVATEHLASSVTRSLLGGVLRLSARAPASPRLVVATPEGERHELGALIAAVTAVGAGADVTYLGPDLPVADVAEAAAKLEPSAVALGVVSLAPGPLRRYLVELRGRVRAGVQIWIGGAAAHADVAGVERIDELGALERRISLLRRRPAAQATR